MTSPPGGYTRARETPMAVPHGGPSSQDALNSDALPQSGYTRGLDPRSPTTRPADAEKFHFAANALRRRAPAGDHSKPGCFRQPREWSRQP